MNDSTFIFLESTEIWSAGIKFSNRTHHVQPPLWYKLIIIEEFVLKYINIPHNFIHLYQQVCKIQ